MTTVEMHIQEGSIFAGSFVVDRLDEEEELVERKFKKTLCLGQILEQVSGGKLNTSHVEVNLDFDTNGELMSIEILGG